MIAGTKVRVITNKTVGCHNFRKGSIVVATGERALDMEQFEGISINHGLLITQVLEPSDYEMVAEAPSREQREVAERVKYLYVVQQEGIDLMQTKDRDFAREVKADLGGKREGVVIMAYAPVKEIR